MATCTTRHLGGSTGTFGLNCSPGRSPLFGLGLESWCKGGSLGSSWDTPSTSGNELVSEENAEMESM